MKPRNRWFDSSPGEFLRFFGPFFVLIFFFSRLLCGHGYKSAANRRVNVYLPDVHVTSG